MTSPAAPAPAAPGRRRPPRTTGTTDATQRTTLPRPARRALLVAHVTASAAWLGLSLGLLALALTGLQSDSPATDAVAYRAMDVFGDWLVAPLALLTFTTGLALSLGTHWGLARHRWVWTKFWLTLAAGTATLLSLRPELDHAATQVAAGHPVDGYSLLFPPSVSLSLYVFMTAISVLKPWGPTRRGRRARADAHAHTEARPRTTRRAASRRTGTAAR